MVDEEQEEKSEDTHYRDKLGRRRPKKREQMPFYSDQVRAWAVNIYKMQGCSSYEASRMTGIPRTTITHWADGVMSGDAMEKAVKIQECLADRLEKVAHAAIDQLEAKMSEASAMDAARILGVVVDKMRLLRDQSTVNFGLTQEDVLMKLASLRERYPHLDEDQLKSVVKNAIPEAQQWIM
jgi:hypothetical protein